jgi:histidinol-phosphate aminotransferase
VFPWPSFIAYPQFTLLAGATIREATLGGWAVDVDAVLGALGDRTRAVVIANPNNPTSTAVRAEPLNRLVDGVPSGVLVVIDEAYREFVTDPDVPDALARFADHPNVVVLRTFSKAWGLAGFRVGYLTADPTVVAAVDAALIPFAVTAAAQAAALAALEQADEVARRAGLVVEERARVTAALADRGLRVPESQANFVWLPVGATAGPLAHALERQGVVTRPFPTGIRVTIGWPHENERFLAAVDAALDELPEARERWSPPSATAVAGS